MSLLEELKSLREQEAEQNKVQDDTAEQKPVEQEAPKVEELKEEPKVEAKEEKPEEEKPKTPADYARERRAKLDETKRLRAELDAANAKLVELAQAVQPKQPEPQVEKAPDPNDDPLAYAQWEAKQAKKEAAETRKLVEVIAKDVDSQKQENAQKQLRQRAMDELLSHEANVKQQIPDYDDAKSFYVNAVAFGIKTLNPHISQQELAERVNNQVLIRASQLANEGYENPVEALYHEVKAMGYKPQTKEEPKSPDLDRVSKNRSRSAGMAGSGSGGRGELTSNYAATQMTVGDYAKLSKAERARLIQQSGTQQ